MFDVEGVEVLEKCALVFLGVLGDRNTGSSSVPDDLVVDIGDVHHVIDWDSLLADEAAKDVDLEEGTEVADVAVVVDSGAAAVHAQCGCADRGEGFNLSAKGVEEFDGCHVSSVPAAAGRVARCRLLSLGIP
jgi:hypothetical protein